jgi:hypothetical protein
VRQWLAPAHLALTLVIIVWDVVLAGRIAQLRQATKPFATITGLAGLLIIPAWIVAMATTTVITGRAISAVDWLWPVIVTLFAVQAVYAVARRIVHPLWGYPIAFYDVLLAITAITRYFAAHGAEPPRALLVLMAGQVDALALGTTEAAIASPIYLLAPMIAPAFPALRRATASFRFIMASLALIWLSFIVAEIPRADIALTSYDSHAGDRLTETPGGFSIGLKLFPDVARPPSAGAVKNDLELADSLGADAVDVVIVPGASMLAIDSVAHALDTLGRDSLLVIVTLGYQGSFAPELSKSPLDVAARLLTLRRVLRSVRPDIVLPAEDPYAAGARVMGRLPVEQWQDLYTRAAAVVKEVRPRTRVGLAASAFDARDSVLYAWAAAAGSPVDIPGFSFYPTRLGARALDANYRAADRWMAANPSRKTHWVFGAGGYPLAHGERSQERSLWASLAWATSHPTVRGLIVNEASDYGQAMGLRAPNGHLRSSTRMLRRAIRALRESTSPQQVQPTTR